MEEWEEDSLDHDDIEFTALTEGVILPLECSECGDLFFGFWDEAICPECKKGNETLAKLMSSVEPLSSEGVDEESEFFAYQRIEYTRGWLSTVVERNVNLPAPTWLDDLHTIMQKHGCLRQDGKGGWKYDYPSDLGDYMRLLTIVAAKSMNPFNQVCTIVRFWRTEYMYVKLMVIEDGVRKMIQHAGPWAKWMKLGKDEEEVNFKPFHPVIFQYHQPSNKGFRQLIDVWRNTVEGGVDALIKLAAEEVFGKNK